MPLAVPIEAKPATPAPENRESCVSRMREIESQKVTKRECVRVCVCVERKIKPATKKKETQNKEMGEDS